MDACLPQPPPTCQGPPEATASEAQPAGPSDTTDTRPKGEWPEPHSESSHQETESMREIFNRLCDFSRALSHRRPW